MTREVRNSPGPLQLTLAIAGRPLAPRWGAWALWGRRSGGRSLSPQPTTGYSLSTLQVELARSGLGESWPEWLIARILLREAKELVEKK